MKIVPRPLTGVGSTFVDQHAGQIGFGGSCHGAAVGQRMIRSSWSRRARNMALLSWSSA